MVIENDGAFGHWLGYVGCVTEYCLYTVGLCIEYFDIGLFIAYISTI